MQPSVPSGAVCAVHPGAMATGACTRCGSFVCADCLVPDLGQRCAKCRALTDGATQPPPWERRGELGLVAAFVAQWKLTMLSPEQFWRSVPAEGPVADPLLYGWFLGALQALPAVLFQAWNFSSMRLQFAQLATQLKTTLPHWFEGVSPWTFALVLTLGPLLIYPLSFYLGAGLTHLGCLITGAAPKGFTPTARIMGYAQAPIVLAWVPVVGGFLALYVVVLQVLGVARVHQSSTARAAFGVLLFPIALTCCLGVAGVAFAIRMVAHNL